MSEIHIQTSDDLFPDGLSGARTGGLRAPRADLLLSARRFPLKSTDLADQTLNPLLQAADFVAVFTPIVLEAVDQPLCSAKIAFRIAQC